MRLFICEKPSQAKDIATVLGIINRHDGYYTVKGQGETAVTWCIGHLLELAEPDDYDPKYKQWIVSDLPIVPPAWQYNVKTSVKKQFNVIRDLLKNTEHVVVATDADREGETIARELLSHCRWKETISRLWLSALDEASIKTALANILPGDKTYPLYQAGLGRSHADWLVGMNLTRLYTVQGRERGLDATLSVGRVQSAALNLVVQRDLEIEQFIPNNYFVVKVTATAKAGAFSATWKPDPEKCDIEGRCIQQGHADKVVAAVSTSPNGTIRNVTVTEKTETNPLAYDLSSLQQEASKRWGMGAQDVLNIAQALYETHKATTYPRTDCMYLPESQYRDADAVLAAIVKTDPTLSPLVDQADRHYRSRVWNDSKISAHHGIIPTTAAFNLTALSTDEAKIYDLIRRRYLAQWFDAYRFHATQIDVACAGEVFVAHGVTPIAQGWKRVYTALDTASDKDDNETEDDDNRVLPEVSVDEVVNVTKPTRLDKKTKPPARFTEGTLIAAMKNIGKTLDDPALKKVLKETSGIGTEATRANIIETMFKREYITKQGKKYLISTELGRALITLLPDAIKSPITTAVWEQQLDQIANNHGSLPSFMNELEQFVTQIIQSARTAPRASAPLVAADPNAPACPSCGGTMRLGSKGEFWGCTKYPECKGTAPIVAKNTKGCPECGKPLRERKGSNGVFLGCSGYPVCKYTENVKAKVTKTRKKVAV